MQEQIDAIIKRLNDLEKKLEMYYQLLKIDNELDFIWNGTYLKDEDVEKLFLGTDEVQE